MYTIKKNNQYTYFYHCLGRSVSLARHFRARSAVRPRCPTLLQKDGEPFPIVPALYGAPEPDTV